MRVLPLAILLLHRHHVTSRIKLTIEFEAIDDHRLAGFIDQTEDHPAVIFRMMPAILEYCLTHRGNADRRRFVLRTRAALIEKQKQGWQQIHRFTSRQRVTLTETNQKTEKALTLWQRHRLKV